MATRSSILPWEILWTEEPGGLHSPRGRGRGRPPSAQSGHGVPTAPFVLGVAVATGRLLFFISRNFKNHPEKVTLL